MAQDERQRAVFLVSEQETATVTVSLRERFSEVRALDDNFSASFTVAGASRPAVADATVVAFLAPRSVAVALAATTALSLTLTENDNLPVRANVARDAALTLATP